MTTADNFIRLPSFAFKDMFSWHSCDLEVYLHPEMIVLVIENVDMDGKTCIGSAFSKAILDEIGGQRKNVVCLYHQGTFFWRVQLHGLNGGFSTDGDPVPDVIIQEYTHGRHGKPTSFSHKLNPVIFTPAT